MHGPFGAFALLLVFVIAWSVALAALGEWAGFSKEAGAFLAGLAVARARWMVSTLPQAESNRALPHGLQAARFHGAVAAAVRDPLPARLREGAGVSLTLSACEDAAHHAARRLAKALRGNPPPLETAS